jgi:hypothetical protein
MGRGENARLFLAKLPGVISEIEQHWSALNKV